MLAVLVGLLAAAPAQADRLTFDNGRLFLQAQINGVPTEALLDSAAEASLVDPTLAKAAQLADGQPITIKGSGGQTQAHIVEGAKISVLGLTLQPEAVVITDLADLSTRLIKRPTKLIVGRELFDATRLSIDIGQGSIGTALADSLPAGKRLPLTAHAGVESIPVTVNGIAAQAEFDLGNCSEVLVSRAFVRRLKLKPLGRKAGGGIGGEVERDLVTLARLDLAGKRYRKVWAAVDDQPNANDLNIGTSILKDFLITTDFRARSVWLQPVASKGR